MNTFGYKITFDPKLSPAGGIIAYAALSGPANNGLYRSMDGGATWTLLKSGQATDVILDPYSGTKDPFGNRVGNLQILYVAFGNDAANGGVWTSINSGQTFTLLNGGAGLPQIQDADVNPTRTITVNNDAVNPNGSNGRIILAKPAIVPSTNANALVENQLYQGWLYALVVNTNDSVNGLYVTKDFGANWTKVSIPTATAQNANVGGTPTNNSNATGAQLRPERDREPGQLRPRAGDRPDQPQYRLHRRRGQRCLDPGRHHDDQ